MGSIFMGHQTGYEWNITSHKLGGDTVEHVTNKGFPLRWDAPSVWQFGDVPASHVWFPREVMDLEIQAIWRCPNFGCLVTETWSCSQQSRKATGFNASLRSVLISNPGPMGVVVDLTSQAPPLRRCAIRFMEVIYQRSIRTPLYKVDRKWRGHYSVGKTSAIFAADPRLHETKSF